MAKNCRFAVAVHISALLAGRGKQPATSEWIATSVNTNPVVVRRILSSLAKAGLVKSSRGINGGSILTRSPESISLLAINRAVDEQEAPPLHHQTPNQNCPVGKRIQTVLTTLLNRMSLAADTVLESTSLAELVDEMEVEK